MQHTVYERGVKAAKSKCIYHGGDGIPMDEIVIPLDETIIEEVIRTADYYRFTCDGRWIEPTTTRKRTPLPSIIQHSGAQKAINCQLNYSITSHNLHCHLKFSSCPWNMAVITCSSFLISHHALSGSYDSESD